MGRWLINGDPVSGFSRDASDIDYDNTGTGLSSTKVQGAISEINSNLINVSVLDRQYVNTTVGRVTFELYSNGQKMVTIRAGSYSSASGMVIVPVNNIPSHLRPVANNLILVGDATDNVNLGYLSPVDGLGVYKGLTGLYIHAIYV